MKRIYIAGPMRGVEDFNRAAFTEHAARLRALGWAGYCITSIARAADALERIADALEEDDDEEESEASK